MSTKLSKRIKFRDRPDILNGKYFIITLPYGLFYLIGAAVGYSKTSNLFCLLMSGFIGILFIILSIAHAIDYYAGANISSFYVSIPFSKLMFLFLIYLIIKYSLRFHIFYGIFILHSILCL